MKLLILLILSFLSVPAFAGPMDGVGPGWMQAISEVASAAATSGQLRRAADAMFIFFTSWAMLGIAIQLYSTGFSRGLSAILDVVFIILIARVLMLSYNEWTSAVFDAPRGIGYILQRSLIGNDSTFGPAAYLLDRSQHMTFTSAITIWSIGNYIFQAICIGCATILTLLLCALSYLATMWAYLGFTVLKLFGLIFIPFLINERFRDWFFNWFTMLIGFALFDAMVRVIVSLIVLSQTPIVGGSGTAAGGMVIHVQSGWEVFPLVIFSLLGIIALANVSSIASSLVSTSGISSNISMFRIFQFFKMTGGKGSK